MKLKNNPTTEFVMFLITVLSIWTAVLLQHSAHEQTKQIKSSVSQVAAIKN